MPQCQAEHESCNFIFLRFCDEKSVGRAVFVEQHATDEIAGRRCIEMHGLLPEMEKGMKIGITVRADIHGQADGNKGAVFEERTIFSTMRNVCFLWNAASQDLQESPWSVSDGRWHLREKSVSYRFWLPGRNGYSRQEPIGRGEQKRKTAGKRRFSSPVRLRLREERGPR